MISLPFWCDEKVTYKHMYGLDHYTFLGNCPPTPSLNQHFAQSEK